MQPTGQVDPYGGGGGRHRLGLDSVYRHRSILRTVAQFLDIDSVRIAAPLRAIDEAA